MIEWSKLRREIQLFISLFSAAILVLGIMLYFHGLSLEAFNQSNNLLRQAQNRYQQAGERKQIVEQYEQRYKALQKQGMFADEQRINWIETLQSSSDRHRIPSVKFEIGQRVMLESGAININTSELTVYYSVMKLDVNLLHEGDLFSLMRDLDQHANGMNTPSRCVLRLGQSGITSGINGECELYWFTFGLSQNLADAVPNEGNGT